MQLDQFMQLIPVAVTRVSTVGGSTAATASHMLKLPSRTALPVSCY